MNMPIEAKTLATHETPNIAVQTGKTTISMDVLTMAFHRHGTPTFMDAGLMVKPRSRATFGQVANLIADPTVGHLNLSTLVDNTTLAEVLIELETQAETYIYGITNGDYPVLPVSTGTTAVLCHFSELMHTILYRSYDLKNLAATKALLLDGSDWDVDSALGVITNIDHISYIQRWIIAFGLDLRRKLPAFNRTFGQQSFILQQKRVAEIYTCHVINIMYQFFLVGAMQSDKAAINIAFQSPLVMPEVASEFKVAIDPVWKYVAERTSAFPAHILAGAGGAWVRRPPTILSEVFIHGIELVETLRLMQARKYSVCPEALKLARTMFGVGVFTSHGERKHFACLLDIATRCIDTTVVNTQEYFATLCPLTEHQWPLLANTMLADYYAEDLRLARDDWEVAMKNNKHWTMVDLETWAKECWIQFEPSKNLQGLAEPEAYLGVRFNVDYESRSLTADWTHVKMESYFSDLNETINGGGALVLNLTNHGGGAAARDPSQMDLYGTLLATALGDDFNINVVFPRAYNEMELRMILWFNILLSRKYDTSAGILLGESDWPRIQAYHHQFDEVFDSRSEDPFGYIGVPNNVARSEDIAPFHNVAFPTITWKYMFYLTDGNPPTVTTITPPRPFGWKDAPSLTLLHVGEDGPSTLDYILGLLFSGSTVVDVATVKTPKAPVTIKPTTPVAPPTPELVVDPKKVEDEDLAG